MIVLAIAGLILAIIFIAVPGLQKSSRDAQRKADISALQSAVATYVGNNHGQVPKTTADLTEATTSIDFSFYNAAAIADWSATPAENTIHIEVFVATTAPAKQTNLDTVLAHDYVVYVEGATCEGTTRTKVTEFEDGAKPLKVGPSRSYAIVYAIESDPNWICIDNV